MPYINMLESLRERDGSPILDADRRELNIRDVMLKILDAALPDDQSGIGKLRLSQLGIKISSHDSSVNLSSSEVTLILERASKLANALVYGQLVLALDPDQLT